MDIPEPINTHDIAFVLLGTYDKKNHPKSSVSNWIFYRASLLLYKLMSCFETCKLVSKIILPRQSS